MIYFYLSFYDKHFILCTSLCYLQGKCIYHFFSTIILYVAIIFTEPWNGLRKTQQTWRWRDVLPAASHQTEKIEIWSVCSYAVSPIKSARSWVVFWFGLVISSNVYQLHINSLRPSDAIWWHGSESGCCLSAPEQMLTNHQWGLVAFEWEQFQKKNGRYSSLFWITKILI